MRKKLTPEEYTKKWEDNYTETMSKIRKTDQRVSTKDCPLCHKEHKNYKVRYDLEEIAFVNCGTCKLRVNVDERWF